MKEGFIKKRCRRCGGNIYIENDQFGWYEQCLQCGHTADMGSIIYAGDEVSQDSAMQLVGSISLAQDRIAEMVRS